MRNVLFLCTANSARSILAEALLNHLAPGRFRAWSAGSRPRGEPNPVALATLAHGGIAAGGARSKSWEEFAGPEAPKMDLVVTVCDGAAGETCPVWPGHPAQAHWGIPDPAGAADEEAAFELALARLRKRIERLLALDEDALDTRAWRDAVTAIGRESEGATHG